MGYIRLTCSLVFAITLTACGNSLSESDLVGTWKEREVQNGVEMVFFLELLPDRTLRSHMRTADKEASGDSTGKWFLTGTKLTTTSDDEAGTKSAEVIKVDESTLTLKDLGTPGNPIEQATRHKGPIPDVVATSVAGSSKLAPSTALPPGTAPAAPQATAAGAPKATASPVRVLIDDYRLIESKKVAPYKLGFNQPRRVHLVLDIEDNTPIDVMLLSAKAAEKYDAMKLAVAGNETDEVIDMLGTMFGKEDANKFKTGSTYTEADFYNRPMSHKAAHRHYETEGVLQAGEYVLFLDNSGDITKTLGDASVHLQVFARDSN